MNNQLFESLGACRDAMNEHAKQTTQEAWDTCKRGDWMLWLASKQYGKPGWPDQKALVMIAAKCARMSLKYVKPGEDRPLKAIEAAELWANDPTEINRLKCKDAAYAAANAAYAYADAANAAYADAAYAANAAAYAANAAYAAYAAYAARLETRAIQADTIRAIWPKVGE